MELLNLATIVGGQRIHLENHVQMNHFLPYALLQSITFVALRECTNM